MMYSVSELLHKSIEMEKRTVSVYGYIAVRNSQLVVLQSDFNRNDWLQTPYIALSNADVQFAIIDQFPTKGGGVSLVFDEAVIDATVEMVAHRIVLDPLQILIRSSSDSPFKAVDMSSKAIKKGKDKWEASKGSSSDLW